MTKPLEYGYVGDRDILFSKMTWEKVVLDERINFPLYFPVDRSNLGDDRQSLYHVLTENMESGMIPKVYADSYFTEERTLKDLAASLTMTKITDAGIDYMNENGVGEDEIPEEYVIKRDIGPADINSYLIKGLWYFDKRQGELKYRILGIAPAAPDVNFIDSEMRRIVSQYQCFGCSFQRLEIFYMRLKHLIIKIVQSPISFDHLLNSRRFSGLIYKEENVYGDREVKEYVAENALMQLLESERIKDKIRNFEQDMWSY